MWAWQVPNIRLIRVFKGKPSGCFDIPRNALCESSKSERLNHRSPAGFSRLIVALEELANMDTLEITAANLRDQQRRIL